MIGIELTRNRPATNTLEPDKRPVRRGYEIGLFLFYGDGA
jgi:hypothetical protein